ncbi:hypothetical protein QU896_28575 [Citrobacter freundii]|uniref:hypothetical protein n=1 Tax=Citrobacter freundii TaxID=546 RepID=UPI0038BA93F7
MTTNHPAHGPVSLERLHQISEILSKAAAQSDGGNIGYAMADAVKVIDGDIAAFGTEPVAYMTYKGYLLHAADPKLAEYSDPTPLYTAPPAPVSVPAAMEMDDDFDSAFEHGKAVGWNAYRAAMLQAGNSPATPDCSCRTCRPVTFTDSRFVVCSECGNKRCPHANDHRNACTGSNEPGQEGRAYPAAPQQE